MGSSKDKVEMIEVKIDNLFPDRTDFLRLIGVLLLLKPSMIRVTMESHVIVVTSIDQLKRRVYYQDQVYTEMTPVLDKIYGS
jgi:hypothetical protein